MDRAEREKSALLFELESQLRRHNLTRMSLELARFETPVTRVMNDLSRFPTVPRGEVREKLFRETFAAVKLEQATANTIGREPAALTGR